MAHASLLLTKCDDIPISVFICLYAFRCCLKRLSVSRRASSDRSSHSNKKGPLICRSGLSHRFLASFQHSQSAFALDRVASNSSTSCTASHFVHPSFQNMFLSLNFTAMFGKCRWERRVIISEGVGQWGGQATIMMCSCDEGWNGGAGSLKSVFEWIRAKNHRF